MQLVPNPNPTLNLDHDPQKQKKGIQVLLTGSQLLMLTAQTARRFSCLEPQSVCIRVLVGVFASVWLRLNCF